MSTANSSKKMNPKASVVMQRLSYPTETVLSNKIYRNGIVPSFKDSPRKPLRRRPQDDDGSDQRMCADPTKETDRRDEEGN